jgi:hypothetical protein
MSERERARRRCHAHTLVVRLPVIHAANYAMATGAPRGTMTCMNYRTLLIAATVVAAGLGLLVVALR